MIDAIWYLSSQHRAGDDSGRYCVMQSRDGRPHKVFDTLVTKSKREEGEVEKFNRDTN